jgi:hypothetical protein
MNFTPLIFSQAIPRFHLDISKMGLNLNPVSLGVREKFKPFQDSVAYPFTRYLPFGTPARYLSLDGCDIRKVFYTVYSEKDNGTTRQKVKHSNL